MTSSFFPNRPTAEESPEVEEDDWPKGLLLPAAGAPPPGNGPPVAVDGEEEEEVPNGLATVVVELVPKGFVIMVVATVVEKEACCWDGEAKSEVAGAAIAVFEPNEVVPNTDGDVAEAGEPKDDGLGGLPKAGTVDCGVAEKADVVGAGMEEAGVPPKGEGLEPNVDLPPKMEDCCPGAAGAPPPNTGVG